MATRVKIEVIQEGIDPSSWKGTRCVWSLQSRATFRALRRWAMRVHLTLAYSYAGFTPTIWLGTAAARRRAIGAGAIAGGRIPRAIRRSLIAQGEEPWVVNRLVWSES